MNTAVACDIPPAGLLRPDAAAPGFADCYCLDIKRPVSQPAFVEAFYTSPLFKMERVLLQLLAGHASTDRDAKALAAGTAQTFAAWRVKAQDAGQLLMADATGRCGAFVENHLIGVAMTTGVEMTTGTVQIHRVLRTTPEKVYKAFLDADAMAKWLPPFGFTCKVDHLNPTVGGTFKMAFTNFSTGSGHAFGGEYLELLPFERIRYKDKFDDPNLPGEMHITVLLKPVLCGTDVSITQAGIPSVIPLEMCYLGWQESMLQLAHLVEPDIPG